VILEGFSKPFGPKDGVEIKDVWHAWSEEDRARIRLIATGKQVRLQRCFGKDDRPHYWVPTILGEGVSFRDVDIPVREIAREVGREFLRQCKEAVAAEAGQ
jgi:hypothetical protein